MDIVPAIVGAAANINNLHLRSSGATKYQEGLLRISCLVVALLVFGAERGHRQVACRVLRGG